jgi:glycerol kinase
MQFLADICGVAVARPAFQEVTALGAAKLAAFGSGAIANLDVTGGAPNTHWTPRFGADERAALIAGWKKAVAATLAAAT